MVFSPDSIIEESWVHIPTRKKNQVIIKKKGKKKQCFYVKRLALQVNVTSHLIWI